MKKVIVLFLGLTLSTTVLFANNDNPITDAKNQLRTEIVKLLGNNKFPLTTKFAKAEISILLNSKNELVIISVESQNSLLESYIKRKLNYKKVKTTVLSKMKIYKMPIKIIQS
ncbi:hypothetical protein [Polaribacter gochangensis]|uniref:hypothetical protein n=1 Tax=Polaribacter gochangensis TaxID=3252903 RepID=UPI003904C8F9